MPHGAEFFWHSGESEQILSAFTEAVKVTAFQKSAIGDLAYPMALR
jgi:hypothetical protein